MEEEEEEEEEESDDGDGQDEIAECVGVEPGELHGDAVWADSATFASPSDERVDNSIEVFATEARTASWFEILASQRFRECLAESTQKLAERAAQSSGGSVGDTTINPISFDSVGDETIAIRLTLPIEAQGVAVDLFFDTVYVRIGRVGVTLSGRSFHSPIDSDELAGYLETLVERIESAS